MLAVLFFHILKRFTCFFWIVGLGVELLPAGAVSVHESSVAIVAGSNLQPGFEDFFFFTGADYLAENPSRQGSGRM
jgi:hypothetical protein